MRFDRHHHLVALLASVALHAMVLALAGDYPLRFAGKPNQPKAEEKIIYLQVLPPPPENNLSESDHQVRTQAPAPAAVTPMEAPQDRPATPPVTQRQPASMPAPPAPTAEEWAFAAKYTLKNSKGYRYNWGQQVRSMMGTAVEGPDQGVVRFRVEIAPDGRLARLVFRHANNVNIGHVHLRRQGPWPIMRGRSN